MNDLRLNSDWDLYITDGYDIQTTDSLAQQINIRLKWYWQEWIFRPEFGVDYFGTVLVKNPNEQKIVNMLTEVIMSVPGVIDVPSMSIEIDKRNRYATISYEAKSDEETIRREIDLWLTE